MARPPNYGFEKRRKEQAAKAKKEARREERRLRKAQGSAGEPVVGEEGAVDATGGEESADGRKADDEV